jgi:cytochrome c-type biogenesis protein CcmH
MFWLIIAIMLLAAVLVVAWPQYREEKRLSTRSALGMICVLAFSAGIYSQIGQPGAKTSVDRVDTIDSVDSVASIEDMVESLSERLEANSGDLEGWRMLGRSYVELRRYPEAIEAYEHATELESYSNGQTLVDLGEAIMLNDDSDVGSRASELFENALAVAPGNQKALFYGGIAAINRGDPVLAADRWETLLASSPPQDIEGILRQRIAEWRGEEVSPALPVENSPVAAGITVNVQLGNAATPVVDPGATLFVIARDPAQPSPPIAAVRRRASELPFTVTLRDSDSMIPGRVISNYQNLEIVVRASASGQPIAQSGDWFGDSRIDTGATRTLDIVIDRQVP